MSERMQVPASKAKCRFVGLTLTALDTLAMFY
jgi:hypothetical protein